MNMTRPLVLALTALLGVAGAQNAETKLSPFSDSRLPFSLSAPSNWYGINLGDGAVGLSMVSAKTKPATLIRLLFAEKAGDEKVNIVTEADNYEADLRASKLEVKRLSSKEVTYGGLKGIEREYQLSGGGNDVRMRVWLGDGPRHLFSFQLTDTADRYRAASETFSKMMATVKFK